MEYLLVKITALQKYVSLTLKSFTASFRQDIYGMSCLLVYLTPAAQEGAESLWEGEEWFEWSVFCLLTGCIMDSF